MTDPSVSPLRRRMIEDMTIRKFAPKTQHDYVQRIKNFPPFLGRSPDTASFEDVRRYQLHLVASGVGVATLNQAVSTRRRADRFHDRGRIRAVRIRPGGTSNPWQEFVRDYWQLVRADRDARCAVSAALGHRGV
jgi:hypothetical protein